MGVEILDHGTRVLTAPGATFGTDALLLARFAQPRRNERALDLCSGCGIVSLVWHDAGHRGPCTALEIDPAASALCATALAEKTDAAHITPVCGDLRQLCTAGPEQGQYDFAACNPPYFTAGPRSPDPRRAEARHTGSCTTADAVDCARRALRDGGRFLLCQRPEQLAEILAALRAARLEPKRLAFSRRSPKGPQNRPARRAGHSDPIRRRPLRANYFVGADMESAPTAQGSMLASTRKAAAPPFPPTSFHKELLYHGTFHAQF